MKKSIILLAACVASVAALSAADPAAKGDGSIVVPSGSKFIHKGGKKHQPMQHVNLTGMLHLQPGPQTLSMVPLSIANREVMILRDITLTLVKK
jgi:hypothetical protein